MAKPSTSPAATWRSGGTRSTRSRASTQSGSASAVLPSDDGGTIVLVVDDKGTAHEKKVQIGVREPELVQAVAGVEPGERVITEGGVGLEDKAKVRVMKPGEKAAGEKDEKDDEKN